MAWIDENGLAKRLNSLPLVLCGPILRQVKRDIVAVNKIEMVKTAVTVWVALKQKADVILTIYDSDLGPGRKVLMTDHRETTTVGENLHIVAVTVRAETLREHALTDGKVYFYDLDFDLGPPRGRINLTHAITKPGLDPDLKRLAYPPFTLPSFVLPPSDLNKLRLIVGSCRKPNGGSKDKPTELEKPDALGLLDGLIEAKKNEPFERPHQLLLTGDQIYADEVADVLLAMLIDAGHTLLGWSELLPAGSSAGGDFGPHESVSLAPTTRTKAIRAAGFTSQDTRSHLMSLSEFLAMYLFAWSEELWTDLPKLTDVAAMNPNILADAMLVNAIQTQREAVKAYLMALPRVRRALANIPSYMIFDDHEITDDWNMSLRFCQQVYSNNLGMRIVQNGLIAFSLCQAWGNAPEQFARDSGAAGFKLLKDVEKLSTEEVTGKKSKTHAYANYDGILRTRVGLQPYPLLKSQIPLGVYHQLEPIITVDGVRVSATSLAYHFTVEGPSHQIIITDTRTWRSFPRAGQDDHPDLLSPKALQQQLMTDPPELGNRLLLIVTTTNMPPTIGIRELTWGVTGAEKVSNHPGIPLVRSGHLMTRDFLYEKDLIDSWEFPSLAVDRFIAMISEKFPMVGGELNGQAVFVSGDVHFSFASRLAYWAEKQRLGDTTTKRKVKAVFAQLVASSLKNEIDKTRGMQRVGYRYSPQLQSLVWPTVPVGYMGWNTMSEARLVGMGSLPRMSSGEPILSPLLTTAQEPTLPEWFRENDFYELYERPDYLYRLDYLGTSKTGQTAPGVQPLAPSNQADRKASAKVFAEANRMHRDLIQSGAKLPDAIGVNNIGEITFVWLHADGKPAISANDPLASNKRVIHKLRWEHAGEDEPYWASYDVSLMIEDPRYPQIRVKKEPGP